MKQIRKNATPRELTNWINGQPIGANGQRVNCRYDDMPADVKQVVKSSLIAEQGGLCCYTGISISDSRSHIEHFKPQSLCAAGDDIEYQNLLAAYPGVSFPGQCSYGAHAKADQYDAGLVSPLDGGCESRFRFSLRGEISGRDGVAEKTIAVLRLDDPGRTENRERAIRRACFRKRKHEALRESQLKDLVERYCELSGGQFRPYCFVITQAAQELLARRRRHRQRQRHAQRSKRK